MPLAYRWFTGLEFDQEVPHHSTFSKNRHGRFQESSLFRDLFETIVRRCIEVGLVTGTNLSVDGTQVLADASLKSRVGRDAFAEAAKINQTVREYLEEISAQNPPAPVAENEVSVSPNVIAASPEKLSLTDPDATWSAKHGPAALACYDHYLIDNNSCIIIGVEATPARFSEETAAAKSLEPRLGSDWTRDSRCGQGIRQRRVHELALGTRRRSARSADRSPEANQERIYKNAYRVPRKLA